MSIKVFLVDDQSLVRSGFWMDGVEATKRLAAADNPARGSGADHVRSRRVRVPALKEGASGFLLKDARPEELLSAIRNVAAGDAVVAPSATRRLLEHVLPSLPSQPEETTPHARLEALTARELEVLAEIAAGATNSEIGGTLYMAEGTVKTHIGRLLSKDADPRPRRVGAVAYQTGLADR